MKIDQKLLETTQAVYLWLFDRTGIYVATIGFGIQISVPFVQSYGKGSLDYMGLALMVFLSLSLSIRYAWQHANKFEAFNAVAREFIGHRIRPYILIFWIVLALVNAFGNWAYALTALLQFFYFGYVSCWQIRKREPPEKLVFAPQASR